jgi:hypothetical protein
MNPVSTKKTLPKTQRLATQPEFLPKKPKARATLRTYTVTGVHNPSSSTNVEKQRPQPSDQKTYLQS